MNDDRKALEAMKALADKAIKVLTEALIPGGISDKKAMARLYYIFDGPEQRETVRLYELARPPPPLPKPLLCEKRWNGAKAKWASGPACLNAGCRSTIPCGMCPSATAINVRSSERRSPPQPGRQRGPGHDRRARDVTPSARFTCTSWATAAVPASRSAVQGQQIDAHR